MEKICLRPHHLLCTQTFLGKGYSEEFVENMTRITNILRTEKSQEIELTFSCDSLCAFCPNRIRSDPGYCCTDDSKVLTYDQNIIHTFHLEEKTYIYAELIRIINSAITPDLFSYLCKDCSWKTICENNIIPLMSSYLSRYT